MSIKRIAFLGLGTMGSGMAGRLLGAGFAVTGYDPNRARGELLASAGGAVAPSPREAALQADVIMAMLPDDSISRAAWLGDQGALAGARPGTICIESGTVTVSWIQELATAAESKRCRVLDCPVTGTKPHAATGELIFMAGGAADTLEEVRPVLKAMSKEIIHLGPVGSGAALKLINNFVCGVQIAALAEAYAFLSRAGLDMPKALPVLLNGAPGSPLVKLISTRYANKDYTPNFQLRFMAKDLTYALAEAQSHQLNLQTAAAALDRFKQAVGAGLGDEDIAALIKYLQNPSTS